VITGFNTDIKHGERIFHVQTEDRGRVNPVVESLVYVGGEILLSKKSPYRDLIQGEDVDEKAVRQIMDSQHRLIIEAIRRGRFDGAKPGEPGPMLEAVDKAFAPTMSPAAAAATAAMLAGNLPERRPPVPAPVVIPPPVAAVPPAAVAVQAPSSLPIAAKAPPPPPAIPRGAARTPSGDGVIPYRSLDQVIIDYLASEAASEHLELSFSRLGGDLVAGEICTLVVKAATSLTGRPVPGANITIRLVVSTAGPPQVLYRGTTGEDGLLRTTVTLPQIGNANAAVIVAGTSAIGSHEVKQLVRRK
jgi:hypothetical protein